MTKRSSRHRKHSSKRQKVYKMKGCSHSRSRKHTSRCFKGGSADANLAYTGQSVGAVRNPFLAYSKQAGGNKLPYNDTKGILAVNKLPVGANLHASFQKGGSVVGGPGGMSQYQPAAFYPNGTVGSSWTPAVSGWPGVGGISSDRNFLSLNTYPNDPQTQNIIGERTTSNYGLKGGSRRSRSRRGGRSRKFRGGTILNTLLPSDIMNPIRSLGHSVQGTGASIMGRPQPPNPLPENGQLVGTTNYSSLAMFR